MTTPHSGLPAQPSGGQPTRSAREMLGPVLGLLAVMWIVEIVDFILGGRLDGYGIVSRDPGGLTGILASPFLHGNFEHLISNTIPFLVLGSLVAWRNREGFWKVLLTIGLLGGLGVWLIGPAYAVTIGASGLVFGMLGYLLVAGMISRHWLDVLVAIAVLFIYGSTLWGALPGAVPPGVSWQAHLTGALAGVLAAFWFAPRRSADA